MRINVNPETTSGGFDYVEAGRQKVRVVSVEQKVGKTSGNPYLNVRLELADPNAVGVKGGKVGNIFAICTLDADKQWKLRELIEACGQDWGDFDTEAIIGLELDAQIGVELDQNEEPRNCIKKFIKA